jgi:hypothetical protein
MRQLRPDAFDLMRAGSLAEPGRCGPSAAGVGLPEAARRNCGWWLGRSSRLAAECCLGAEVDDIGNSLIFFTTPELRLGRSAATGGPDDPSDLFEGDCPVWTVTRRLTG